MCFPGQARKFANTIPLDVDGDTATLQYFRFEPLHSQGNPIPIHAQVRCKTQAQRQKFLEGRGAGRENLFPKRFPSPPAFLSSNLQASACRPCRTMFFLRGDSLARSPTRHCSPAGERVSGTGTNIDDNSARPFPKTKKSPAERGQKKTPSRCELQGGLEQSLAAAYFPT